MFFFFPIIHQLSPLHTFGKSWSTRAGAQPPHIVHHILVPTGPCGIPQEPCRHPKCMCTNLDAQFCVRPHPYNTLRMVFSSCWSLCRCRFFWGAVSLLAAFQDSTVCGLLQRCSNNSRFRHRKFRVASGWEGKKQLQTALLKVLAVMCPGNKAAAIAPIMFWSVAFHDTEKIVNPSTFDPRQNSFAMSHLFSL